MEEEYKLLFALGVVVLLFGVAIGTGMLEISIWSHEEDEQFSSWATSGPFIGRVGWPCPYTIMQYDVQPYMGPYEYHWDFGDGTVEDGRNSSKHIFSTPGVYHVTVQVTGKDEYLNILNMGTTTIIDADSMGISITDTGHCHWNESHEGDMYLNLTIWNNETFPLNLAKYSFPVYNASGYPFDVKEQDDDYRTLLGRTNMTWTIFYEEGDGVPVELAYFSFFEWSVDWKES